MSLVFGILIPWLLMPLYRSYVIIDWPDNDISAALFIFYFIIFLTGYKHYAYFEQLLTPYITKVTLPDFSLKLQKACIVFSCHHNFRSQWTLLNQISYFLWLLLEFRQTLDSNLLLSLVWYGSTSVSLGAISYLYMNQPTGQLRKLSNILAATFVSLNLLIGGKMN